MLKLTLFMSKPVSRVAFHLRKYQNCLVEFHFSCQNVNFCFGGRYDKLEARNKNKPHQHLEIYPITFFGNFETTFWASQTATGRFRCWECLHWKERIFLSRIHVSTSFWDVRMTTKTSNLFAQKRLRKWPREASNCYYTCILIFVTLFVTDTTATYDRYEIAALRAATTHQVKQIKNTSKNNKTPK